MYSDIPLYLAIAFIVLGLVALAWSSDRFVVGSAALAKDLGVSPFIIGMVVVGFGTSAPELIVSAFAGIAGHSNLSLGNAYGSCIFNIAAILGISAMIRPLVVRSKITLIALPLLLAITIGSAFLLKDGGLSRMNAFMLLAAFAIIMPAYGKVDKAEPPKEDSREASAMEMSTAKAAFLAVVGLVVMVAASHLLVWGAADSARALGVDDLLIGLTIVAIGTSIPELASAIAAARRNEADLVLGNIVGSNLFNMLAVVGIAGAISPIERFSPYVLRRDLPVLFAVTAITLLAGVNYRKWRENGVIKRFEGALMAIAYIGYMALTTWQEALGNG